MTNSLPPIPEAGASAPRPPSSAVPPPTTKRDASFALKNNKDKPKPPSPPLKIRDGNTQTTYTRMGLLGEGGFARVYEVISPQGARLAAKVVYKNRLDDQKKKTRLYAEIKIHKMMIHPHIVRFFECFEDEENVYMILELCPNGSMVELLRRRRRFTEPETRYYLLQIISACQYMHKSRVMHRDLKLGNLFIDSKMNVKLGDFGLAALIENEGDRRKTVCGTPNYIAPEVLYGRSSGHSYEADVWSVGVTLYTMLVGRPPFQTKEVKNIYKRIKDLNYTFPEEAEVPASAQDLITRILTQDPKLRPTLEQILSHEWFQGEFPPFIPNSALREEPDFGIISVEQSKINFQRAKERSAVGRNLPIAVPSPARVKSAGQARQAIAPAVAEQERAFKKAVQPDSPISDLLSSARKPLVVAPQSMGNRDPPLMRRFAGSGTGTGSPLRREVSSKKDAGKGLPQLGEADDEENEDIEDEENQPPQRAIATTRISSHSKPISSTSSPLRDRQVLSAAGRKINARSPLRQNPPRPSLQDPVQKVTFKGKASDVPAGLSESTSTSLYNRMAKSIDEALAAKENGRTWFPEDIHFKASHPRHFIASWLDYCKKYGMGYAMTDGTVGVNFNDSSVIVLAPNKINFDCIEPEIKADGMIEYTRRSHTIENYPESLDNRVYLINHFTDYLKNKLNAQHSFTFEDPNIRTGMVFATRYLRTKHVVLFRLSNDLLQLNFIDHTKLLISGDSRIISFIDKEYQLFTWTLAALTQTSTDGLSKPERKRVEQVLYKVRYARDLLSKVEHYMKAGPRKQRATKHASMNGTAGFERDVAKVEAGM